MKFGVFSVCAPEYGIPETVQLLKELGCDGVEWRVQRLPREKPADVPYDRRYWLHNRSTLDLERLEEEAAQAKALCDQAGLKIFGLTSYLSPGQHREIERLLEVAASIGCPQARVFPPAYDEKENYPALFSRMRADTLELEKLARKHGVKILYEIHMDNLLSSPSAARRMLEGCDPAFVGVIFDPGNMVYEGFENYQKSFEMLGDYIAHIHMKNALLTADGLDGLGAVKWKREWAPLKKGMADLSKCFEAMRRSGYDGAVCIEDFSNEEGTAEKLRHDMEYLRALSRES